MSPTSQERRAIVLYPSLNRLRLIMGMDPTLFMALTLAVVLLALDFQLRPTGGPKAWHLVRVNVRPRRTESRRLVQHVVRSTER